MTSYFYTLYYIFLDTAQINDHDLAALDLVVFKACMHGMHTKTFLPSLCVCGANADYQKRSQMSNRMQPKHRGDDDYCRVPGTRQLYPLEVGEDNYNLNPKN